MFMTQPREEQSIAGNDRRDWAAPAVRRMRAGDAEIGNTTSTDGGITFS
jgi:hypothetical protein